ncbi:MAG: protein kinase, partial [Cystobacter sp.]
EIRILVHLENPGVVRYVGSDFWPNPARGHPYIVMEYVPGDTLEAFALQHNPSSRQCMRILLDVTRTLGEVHAAGVFHRDLKPTNILIRETSERPVLIDFGIATLEGARCLTETRLPPATEEFRAPEPLRFWREKTDDAARYEYTLTDELWALGVTFYWLLTDVYPFGDRTDEGAMAGLRERILTRRPVAPHLLNPRVPLAASRLCMKMLAEWPQERHANVPELCSALQEALTQAEHDASWDVPLIDPNDPQITTTLEDLERREPDEAKRLFMKWGRHRPRRGLVRPNKIQDLLPPPFPVEAPRIPVPEVAQDIILTMGASQEAVSAEKHEPHGDPQPPATSVQVMTLRSPLAPPVTARLFRASWRLGLAAALATLAAVGLSVSPALWGPGASGPTGKGQTERMRSSASPIPGSAEEVVAGHEMAPATKPLDSSPGESAVPVGAPPPALNANAMPRTPAQTKKNETQTQRAGLRLPVKPATVAAAALAGCTLVEGCTNSTTQVRPGPPAITCPQGWKETHKRFGIDRDEKIATVKGYKGEPGEMARVKEGPAVLEVRVPTSFGEVGELPEKTLLLGTWQLGDNRLFGTFTEAKIPGEGTLPVCLVVGLDLGAPYKDESGKIIDCPPGLGQCLAPGSRPDNAKTPPRIFLVRPTGQP